MAFLGMRGTGDWVNNARPESWREMILHLFPNGRTPLTAIMSKITSEVVNDPKYHWWEKLLPDQTAAIVSVWLDPALTIPYNGAAAAAAAGDTLYFRMVAVDQEKARPGHIIRFMLSTDSTMIVVGKVTASIAGGANSYWAVLLLEADDNSATNTLTNADTGWIIGNANAEGATSPDSLMYDPEERFNYTQIFRTPLEHTRTAIKTRLRTGDQVVEARREALELHSIEIEKAFIFGLRTQRIGANGKPERTTGGIRNFLTTNVVDYRTSGNGPWLTGGEAWFDSYLEQLFRFGQQEKLALCGSGAVKGLNDLAKARGRFELTKLTKSYGIQVLQWVTPFGTVQLVTHPLFTYQPLTRNSMLFVEPRQLKTRFIDDTAYKPNIQANDLDGEKSEYKSEIGLELNFEQVHGWADGVGLNP